MGSDIQFHILCVSRFVSALRNCLVYLIIACFIELFQKCVFYFALHMRCSFFLIG